MDFRITRHSGFAAPDDALDRLWERLGARRAGTSFTRGHSDIRARSGTEAPLGMEDYEREELGRSAVLEIVQAVCAQTPELNPDWYAVSPKR
jgi:hypothetical protein